MHSNNLNNFTKAHINIWFHIIKKIPEFQYQNYCKNVMAAQCHSLREALKGNGMFDFMLHLTSHQMRCAFLLCSVTKDTQCLDEMC